MHIVLPVHDCKEINYDVNWYMESFFWNNREEKQKAIQHFEDEYKFSKDKCWKKIYDEWLHYLKHSLKGANNRSSGKSKSKRILLNEKADAAL